MERNAYAALLKTPHVKSLLEEARKAFYQNLEEVKEIHMNTKLADQKRTVSRMLEILGYGKMAKEVQKEGRVEVLRQYARIVLERARGEHREKALRWFGYLELV